MSTENPWKTLDEKIVYENPWIQVSHRNVINPGGGKGIYGLVHFKNIAVGVIPLDKEMNTWIVGQYRYPTDCYSWEIPEGGGPHNESSLEAAKRELLEETGILAKEWKTLINVQLSNSVSDERGIIFVAQDLDFQEAEPEESEDLKVRKLPFKKLYQMAMDGEIEDALSLAAIFKLNALLESGTYD